MLDLLFMQTVLFYLDKSSFLTYTERISFIS